MKSIDRAKAYANGEPVDRLLCSPGVDVTAARIYGCPISDFSKSGKILADAQIAAYREFGYDGINIFTDLFTWCEASGCEVTIPYDGTPDLKTPAISKVNQICQLQPADPYHDGRLPVHLDAMKYLKDQVGDEVDCSATVIGPFTNTFFFMGVNETLKLLIKNPEVVHAMCRISLETCKRYAAAVIKEGLTPGISDPMSSCTVVSPGTFREFSKPYLAELIDSIKTLGITPSVHICGQTDKIWEDLVSLGISGLSVDNVVDLCACKNAIGDRIRIAGNVDPSGVMFNGTPALVREKTLACMKAAYDSPKGYIVMSGCSLPADTPPANIKAMVDTVAEVGYPVTLERIEKLSQK